LFLYVIEAADVLINTLFHFATSWFAFSGS
jgi:hypothetical protein